MKFLQFLILAFFSIFAGLFAYYSFEASSTGQAFGLMFIAVMFLIAGLIYTRLFK